MKARLVLEDGSSFDGISIGATGEIAGKVVLNTAVVGYQEMMTDPANAGKILVLTYPLIGNYGVAKKFNESKRCWISGLVIKEESRIYSNWQAEGSFNDFIKDESLAVISDVDTRTLAVNIRDRGEMFGIIAAGSATDANLLKKLKECKESAKNDFIKDISVKRTTDLKTNPPGPKIAVLDLGMANSFIKQLTTLGCNVTLLPFDIKAKAIAEIKPDGLIISNGPEDDMYIPSIAQEIKQLIGKVPMLGISTGHEILGLSLGGRLRALKIGHRGVNYPVKSADSYKGEITVQNHSLVVDENSIKDNKNIMITLRNLNDNTIEEMESKTLKFISTQYYPVSPGFDEVNEVFKRFLAMAGIKKGAVKHHIAKSGGCREACYAKA